MSVSLIFLSAFSSLASDSSNTQTEKKLRTSVSFSSRISCWSSSSFWYCTLMDLLMPELLP